MSANAPAPSVHGPGWQGPIQPAASGGGGYGALGASASAISALSSVGSAYSQASAARAEASFTDTMADINDRFAALKAEDAIRRGDKEAGKQKLSARKIIGRQRAALAAQGVNLAEGTPLEVQEETAAIGAIDALTIRNNAYREAWGYKVEALTRGAQAGFQSLGLRSAARQTLLTGGLAAARDITTGLRDYRRGRA